MNDTHQPDENPGLSSVEPSDIPTEESISEETSTTDEITEFATGSWIRLVFTDEQGQKKIETVFVSDNPEKSVEKLIEDYDDENTNDWVQLLGNPQNVNIDEGIAILRLDEEAEIATVTWISSTKGLDIVRHTIEHDSEGSEPPTASASQFRECFINQSALLNFAAKFDNCKHLIFS